MEIKEIIDVLRSVKAREVKHNEKINKLCNNPSDSIAAKAIDEAIELIKKLENAFIPPCKFGDTIYWVGTYRGKVRIVEYKVENITLCSKIFILNCGNTLHFLNSEIGKTVYLTYEEAEKALERKRD
jgi:uncharacterized protein with PIN domain